MAVSLGPNRLEGFIALASDARDEGRVLEWIDGKVVEVSPGRTLNSEIGHILAVEVHLYCRTQGIACHTSGEAGAYQIGEHVLVPDFAYKRQRMSAEYPDVVPPLWVDEIISPTDNALHVRRKRQIYLEAGILYWEVYPEERSVDVYAPGQPVRSVEPGMMIDGGDVLPGFQLALDVLFSDDSAAAG